MPVADIARLIRTLVGAGEQHRWNFKAECLGSCKVDNKAELICQLHRKVRRLSAFEDRGGVAVLIVNYPRFLAVIGFCGLAFGLPVDIANLSFISFAMGQSTTLTKSQSDALNAYNKTVQDFRSVLSERRAQINSNQKLPERPGQALYLARIKMMGAYTDLTDALPSKIGRPNKYGIPPTYFDADNEPLIDEYKNLFAIMQAPPANAQKSDTPFEDVVDLGIAIARIKGLDAAHAEVAGRISLAIFFAETAGIQNIGNARSNTYKGSFQTGVSEDKNGQKKWAAIKKSVAALDPKLNARDDKEEARVGNSDQRYNHWTAVRNGLMNAHADLFPKIPIIMKALPNPIDQMRFLSSSKSFPVRPYPRSILAIWSITGFPNRVSWDTCAITACLPLARLTERKHL